LVFTEVDVLGIASDYHMRRHFSTRGGLRPARAGSIDDADNGVARHEGHLGWEWAESVARLHVRQADTSSQNLDPDFLCCRIPQVALGNLEVLGWASFGDDDTLVLHRLHLSI